MKFKIEPKFVNDYLYSQSQKKKEIQNRKRKMRIKTEIENGFSKMFSDKIEEYDNQKGKLKMKKEIVGYVNYYSGNWGFETDEESYSSNLPTAIDELLEIDSQDGDRFKITIEKLN